MVAEGVWPKADGDYGYASEINTCMRYIDSDATLVGTTADTETTLATLTIPANSVGTGLAIIAAVFTNFTGVNQTSTYNLKVGPTGSEVTKNTIILTAEGTDGYGDKGGALVWYDASQTWSAEVTVLITSSGDAFSTKNCKGAIALGH